MFGKRWLAIGMALFAFALMPSAFAKDASDYRPKAEAGDAKAQYHLGYCYARGIGVKKDLAQAVIWFHKAAEQGNANAQFQLGNAFRYGKGVEKDKEEAKEWYEKAAKQGHKKAKEALEEMEFDLFD